MSRLLLLIIGGLLVRKGTALPGAFSPCSRLGSPSPRRFAGGCPAAGDRSTSARLLRAGGWALRGGDLGYRNVTRVASPLECGWECLMMPESGGLSFNYVRREQRCELNGASAARYPLALVSSPGTDYYGNHEYLVTWISASNGSVGITDCTYSTHSLASDDCQASGQHLCYRWEINKTVAQEGYPLSTPVSGAWFAETEARAVLTGRGSGVTYLEGPPHPQRSPARGLCCSPLIGYADPFVTPEWYALDDRVGQVDACARRGAHLCTLDEALEAYGRGYRQNVWTYCALPSRDLRILACDAFGVQYSDDECYSDGLIVNTPRPHSTASLCCSPDRA